MCRANQKTGTRARRSRRLVFCGVCGTFSRVKTTRARWHDRFRLRASRRGRARFRKLCQTEPGSASNVLGREEWLDDESYVLVWNSSASIAQVDVLWRRYAASDSQSATTPLGGSLVGRLVLRHRSRPAGSVSAASTKKLLGRSFCRRLRSSSPSHASSEPQLILSFPHFEPSSSAIVTARSGPSVFQTAKAARAMTLATNW
jgi:hypothetical protein